MAFLTLLFSGSLIIIATAINSELAQNKSHNPAYECSRDVIHTNYEFKITPFFEDYDDITTQLKKLHRRRKFLRTNSIVTFNITHPTKFIKWHLKEVPAQIRKTKLWNVGENGERKEIYNCRNIYSGLSLIFSCVDYVLKPGSYIMDTEFIDDIDRNVEGMFSTSFATAEGNKSWVAVSELQKFGRLLTFPCWIESGLKAKFTIYSENYQKYIVLSNVPIKMDYMFENDKVQSQFFIDPETSTDFFVFNDFVYVGDFDIRPKVICRSNFTQDAYFLLNTYYNVTMYLEKEWHMNSSVRIDQVVLPRFRDGNVKLRRLELYSEEDIMYDGAVKVLKDKALKDSMREMEITRLLTRRIIARWFGDKNNDESSWLIEGLATYMEESTIDKVLPKSRMLDLFVVQLQRESMRWDCSISLNLLKANNRSDIDSRFFSPRHIRAPFVLRMLQHLITKDVFRQGIQQYFNAPFSTLNSTTPHDFWSVMQSAIDKLNYTSKSYLTHFIKSWTNERCCLQLDIFDSDISGSLIPDFESFYSWHRDNWLFFLTYTLQANPNFTKTSLFSSIQLQYIPPAVSGVKFSYLGSEETIFTNFNRNGWIIANLQQIGYYRVNYSLDNWKLIANYLNSNEFRKIHVLNRAQIIDDAFDLVVEKNANISIFWMVASYLSREIDYIPWYPMIKALEYISSFFPFLDERMERAKGKLWKILDGFSDAVQNKTNWIDDDLNKYLIDEVAMWSCNLGYYKFLEEAKLELELYLKNPNLKKNKILPQRKAWTYCKGLMRANSTIWNKVVHVWLQKNDNKILEFLACSQSSDIIKDYLQLMMPKKIIRDKKNVYSIIYFHSIIEKHARNFKVLVFILSHFWIIPRQINTVTALIDIITHVYSEGSLDKVTKYAKDNLRQPLISKLESKVTMRLREIQRQMDHLQKILEIRKK